jgi:hypothetical protein
MTHFPATEFVKMPPKWTDESGFLKMTIGGPDPGISTHLCRARSSLGELCLVQRLVNIEEHFQLRHFRHVKTVERIIGYKRGITGGSSMEHRAI